MKNNDSQVNTNSSKQGDPSLPLSLVVGISLLVVLAVILYSVYIPDNSRQAITLTDGATYTDTDTDTIGHAVETITDLIVESSVAESSIASSKVESSAPQKNPSSSTSTSVSKPSSDDIIKYNTLQTYSVMWKGIEQLAEKYSHIMSYSSYGSSVQGRSLPLVKIGTGSKKGLVVAGMHGSEHITTAYAMRCIEEYCRAYDKGGSYGNYNIKQLLTTYTLYIVPNCNPDGSEIATNGASPSVSIKNFKRSEYKANANGVNLNRNFPFYFDQLKMEYSVPHNEYYKGPSGASEPETKALISLCSQNSFRFMLTLHVRGDCTYWSDSITPNAGSLSAGLASLYSSQLGITPQPKTTDVNGYAGGFENWFRYNYRCPGICVELMPMSCSISGSSASNEVYFDSSVRWNKTKYLIPLTMNYVG